MGEQDYDEVGCAPMVVMVAFLIALLIGAIVTFAGSLFAGFAAFILAMGSLSILGFSIIAVKWTLHKLGVPGMELAPIRVPKSGSGTAARAVRDSAARSVSPDEKEYWRRRALQAEASNADGKRRRRRPRNDWTDDGNDEPDYETISADDRWFDGETGTVAMFEYVDADGVVTERRVRNWRSSGPYVYAYCLEGRGNRTFRKDRISEWIATE